MTTHAMIDLETLSTNPNAVILTVGGVKFNPYNAEEPAQPMYFRVDVDSQTAMGRDVMQETLDWWATQPKEISEEALGDDNRISLEEMVRTINRFAVGVDVFWCQGPLFDYAILQNLYSQLGHPQANSRLKNFILSGTSRNRKQNWTTQRTGRLLFSSQKSATSLSAVRY